MGGELAKPATGWNPMAGGTVLTLNKDVVRWQRQIPNAELAD